jgi:cystathionine beta-lyase/cystathionine gamma-synthase
LFDGFSGMPSFEPKGSKTASEQFMKNVTIPIIAPSLGGVESLLTRPAATSHSGMSIEDRKKLGITDGLIRVSIGVEATDDLIEDFAHGLKAVRTVSVSTK